MRKIRKDRLKSAWKKLDKALEALEMLEENGVDIWEEYRIDFSGIVSLKSEVEEELVRRSKDGKI